MQCDVIFYFLFLIKFFYISARWLPPLRINKVKVKIVLCFTDDQFVDKYHLFSSEHPDPSTRK